MGLWVHVDQAEAMSPGRDCCAEIGYCRGFSHAAFLIDYCHRLHNTHYTLGFGAGKRALSTAWQLAIASRKKSKAAEADVLVLLPLCLAVIFTASCENHSLGF